MYVCDCVCVFVCVCVCVCVCLQPISWWSLAVLLLAGGGVVLYVQKIKKEKEEGESLIATGTKWLSSS